MAEEKVGEVIKYFAKPQVAAIKVIQGEIETGNTVRIVGHTSEVTCRIDSMEVDNKKVQKAVAGDFVGVKVADKVREGDAVYKVL